MASVSATLGEEGPSTGQEKGVLQDTACLAQTKGQHRERQQSGRRAEEFHGLPAELAELACVVGEGPPGRSCGNKVVNIACLPSPGQKQRN